MKQIYWIIIILLSFVYYDVCAQQTISYQNDEHENLNITLNGKVRYLKQVSYSPDILCDTIKSRFHPCLSSQTGMAICVKCSNDTIIYVFDKKLFPKKIEFIETIIDVSNWKYQEKTIYAFKNGNLIERTYINDAIIYGIITYKYDLNNNMILEKRMYDYKDTLEYDTNNNLIKKTKYILERREENEYKKVNELYEIDIYRYGSFSNLITHVHYHLSSNFINKEIYVYDTLGNKIEEIHYNDSKPYDENNPFCDGVEFRFPYTHIYYKYDEQGRNIENKVYSIKKENTVLLSHHIYEYNENDQQIKDEIIVRNIVSYDYSKNYEKLFTTYDDYKNIIQQSYYINDTLVKIVRYVYTYDTFENWIKREKYEGKNEEELSKSQIEERVIKYYD